MSVALSPQQVRAIERGVFVRERINSFAGALVRDRYHRYSLRTAPVDALDGPDEQELHGVTSIIGKLDKSGALSTWASKTQYAADVLAAFEIYEEGLPTGLTFEHFATVFKTKSKGATVFNKERDDAANFGSMVHALLEHRIKEILCQPTTEPPASDMALRLFAQWERWAEVAGFYPYATEFGVFSAKDGVAGTADCLGEIEGGAVTLPDWKTANDIYAEAYLQNVAYRRMAAEMGITDGVAVGHIVKLPKKAGDMLEVHRLGDGKLLVTKLNDAGVFEVVREEPANEDVLWKVFLHLRGLYPWAKEEDRKSYARWKQRKGLKS
jgi:hypothetical protein